MGAIMVNYWWRFLQRYYHFKAMAALKEGDKTIAVFFNQKSDIYARKWKGLAE